jgi:hypothetical protein
MRSLLAPVCLVTWLSFPGPLSAAAPAPPTNPIAIEVARGDWQSARVEEIAIVLNSVVEVLLPYFPHQTPKRLVVASSQEGPHVLRESSPGAGYRVFLTVRGTRWDQFAYQFAHELCHVFANHEPHAPGPDGAARAHQWFEEALCETVSLFALRRMTSSWESAPPYRHWRAYAPAFREYAERLQAQQHRHLSPDLSLREWFEKNEAQLKRDPYLREKNELLATLLLPLFEQNPGGLAAIAYLNSEEPASSQSLDEYLENWYRCCPDEHRSVVRQAIRLFRPVPSPIRSA